ncbi:hypothetical protein Taro_051183 [Colocasia esculenta]|uniref:Uncharacterized protein n=1 Tax=Colocasia esculenta TaxID=4460 RepID=A0A843XFB4_COLES|nr:hypothetical protein [Colocasia esculenta]
MVVKGRCLRNRLMRGWASHSCRGVLRRHDCFSDRRDRCPVCQNGRVGWQFFVLVVLVVRWCHLHHAGDVFVVLGARRRWSFRREGPNGSALLVELPCDFSTVLHARGDRGEVVSSPSCRGRVRGSWSEEEVRQGAHRAEETGRPFESPDPWAATAKIGFSAWAEGRVLGVVTVRAQSLM